MLGNDITKFMTDLPAEEIQAHWEDTEHTDDLDKTPFMHAAGEGVNAGMDESEWVVEKDRQKYLGTMLPLSKLININFLEMKFIVLEPIILLSHIMVL